MAKSIKSPTAAAAQLKFFEENNIQLPEPQKKDDLSAHEKRLDYIPVSELGLLSIKDFGIYIDSINKSVPIISMTDSDIVAKILYHYDGVLKFITGHRIVHEGYYVKEYITQMGCHMGICRYSRVELGVIVSEREWVMKYNKGEMWCEFPHNCYEYKELVRCISFRVEILTEILNQLNDIR